MDGDAPDADGCIDPDPDEFGEGLTNPAAVELASGSRSRSSNQEMLHTPQGPRLAKKRKMDPVTPQPDYQTMPTPSLKVRRVPLTSRWLLIGRRRFRSSLRPSFDSLDLCVYASFTGNVMDHNSS